MKPPRTGPRATTASVRPVSGSREGSADFARPGANAVVEFMVPIRTYSKLNQRIHWAARAKQAKAERTATWAAASEACSSPIALHFWWAAQRGSCVVILARISQRTLDDDNLCGALKAVRDEVARLLGVDDRDPRVRWDYAQEKGKPSVRVRIEAAR